MMKDVTILTFDEMEYIRQEIDRMIENAKDGAFGNFDAKNVCTWFIKDLEEFRKRFE